MNAPARQALTVFLDGRELPGVIFYGLWPGDYRDEVSFPAAIWPEADARPFRLRGEAWQILGWDVAVQRWPSEESWRDVVRSTLEDLIRRGSVVAWMGAEGSTVADPPWLFSREWMADSVLAAMLPDGQFMCAVALDSPVQSLQDHELEQLRERTIGLTDTM